MGLSWSLNFFLVGETEATDQEAKIGSSKSTKALTSTDWVGLSKGSGMIKGKGSKSVKITGCFLDSKGSSAHWFSALSSFLLGSSFWVSILMNESPVFAVFFHWCLVWFSFFSLLYCFKKFCSFSTIKGLYSQLVPYGATCFNPCSLSAIDISSFDS